MVAQRDECLEEEAAGAAGNVQAPPRVAYFPPKSPLELMQMPTWDPHRTPPREPKAQVVVGENAHVQPCHDRLAQKRLAWKMVVLAAVPIVP